VLTRDLHGTHPKINGKHIVNTPQITWKMYPKKQANTCQGTDDSCFYVGKSTGIKGTVNPKEGE